MQVRLGTIVCKFGGDRVTFVVEEAICAKFTDRQTDGRRTPRDCISSFQWNELKMMAVSLESTDITRSRSYVSEVNTTAKETGCEEQGTRACVCEAI